MCGFRIFSKEVGEGGAVGGIIVFAREVRGFFFLVESKKCTRSAQVFCLLYLVSSLLIYSFATGMQHKVRLFIIKFFGQTIFLFWFGLSLSIIVNLMMIFAHLYYYKHELHVNTRCFDWAIRHVSLGLRGAVNSELTDGCTNITE